MKQVKLRHIIVAALAMGSLFIVAGCKDNVTEKVKVEYVVNNQTDTKYKVSFTTDGNGNTVTSGDKEVDANKNMKITLENVEMIPVGSRTVTALYWDASGSKPTVPGKDATDDDKQKYKAHTLDLTVTTDAKLTNLYIRPEKSGSTKIVFSASAN
ncbi:MAG: hypothetical protein ACTTKL_10300 [Treponema sp.]